MATAAFESILPNILPLPVPRRLLKAVSHAAGINQAARIYEHLCAMDDGRSLIDRLLDNLRITCAACESDLARVPRKGAAIVTVNHPYGLLDGAALAGLLGPVRNDLRILGNRLLTTVPELDRLVIPVNVEGHGNSRPVRLAIKHLEDGGMLVVFPAGSVSHFQWKERSVADSEWSSTAARLAKITRAVTVPVYIEGANGPAFQLAGMAHPGLRTAMLIRELLNKRGRRVEVRIGVPVPAERLLAIPDSREQTDYLRWRTYLLASRQQFKPNTSAPLGRRSDSKALPVAPEAPTEEIAEEIAALPDGRLFQRSGDLEAYLAPAAEIPKTLRELGRLREITFRAAGEGTGKPLDIDEFDDHYLHLFVWNARRRELVGAYRLACTDAVRERFGVRGLYTAGLFRYDDRFLDRVDPAVELGRSFVRQEYQRAFAPLLLLWKAIGAFIAKNPRYKIVFGPVSISNRYEAVSRELMASFLEKRAFLREWAGLVRSRHAARERVLRGARRPVFPDPGFDLEDLSQVVDDIEQQEAGIPVLLRQYLRLGGKLLGFNVDPKFGNALDGLMLVDLTKTAPKLVERYFGKTEAAEFFQYQKGINGTH
jgi:putative hemolysin